jgi:hypothetical protein
MVKKNLFSCVIFASSILLPSISFASVEFAAMPCTFNSLGEVTNTSGHPASGSFNICDIPAEQIKIKVYKMAMCTAEPLFNDSNEPDLSACQTLYSSSSGYDVTVSASGGLILPDLIRPSNGSYGYFLFVLSNTMSVKAKVRFDRDITAEADMGPNATTGRACWTITDGDEHNAMCGDIDDIGNSPYGFNDIITALPDTLQGRRYQGSNEETVGGYVSEYFTDSSLITVQGDVLTNRWVNVYKPNSNLIISDTTTGLKMSIDVSSGAGLSFDSGTPDQILDIMDAPLAYIIETLN